MASWQCVACGRDLEARERVGRRDLCPGCGAELHSCRQCALYDPSAYNACHEPQAERVLGKEKANFCEYYEPVSRRADTAAARTTGSARAALDALFRKR